MRILTVTKQNKRTETADMRILRVAAGYSLIKKRNEDIRKELQVTVVITRTKDWQTEW